MSVTLSPCPSSLTFKKSTLHLRFPNKLHMVHSLKCKQLEIFFMEIGTDPQLSLCKEY